MSDSFYDKDLTQAQWNRIKFVFEEPTRVRRPSLNPRMVLNGIFWIFKSEGRWCGLFERFDVFLNFVRRLLFNRFAGGDLSSDKFFFVAFGKSKHVNECRPAQITKRSVICPELLRNVHEVLCRLSFTKLSSSQICQCP